jgi:hypothetical protein
MNQIPERKDLKAEETWALEDIFPSDEAWTEELERAGASRAQLMAYAGRLGESAETLLSFLRLDDEISLCFDALVNYVMRRGDEDTRVAKYQNMTAQLMHLITQLNTASAFETNELLAIPDETLEQFYTQVPELSLYRRSLEVVRRKREHILSPAEEQLLAQAGGEVVATQIKTKLQPTFNTVGINSSNTYVTFNQDGTFTASIAGKQWSGKYTYDAATSKVTMQGLLLNVNCYAKKNASGIGLLFEASKLLTVLKTMSALSGNTSLQTIGDLAGNYDGVRIGFDMK